MNTLLKLLVESWRGRVPLLYSNLELVLPIGAKETSVQCLNSSSGLQSDLAPSDTGLHNYRPNGHFKFQNVISKTINSKHIRNISRLSRRRYNTCDTTSSSSTKQRTFLSLNGAPSSGKIEENTAKVETVFLDALIEFFDLMSYLDATLPAAAPLVSGSCRPEAFVWTGAEIKDGLLDERGEEECKSWSQERLLNIQSAVEGLGCHKCCRRMSEAWTKAQNYRQKMEDNMWERLVVLPAASKRQSLSFSVQPLCAPRWVLCQPEYGLKLLSLKCCQFISFL